MTTAQNAKKSLAAWFPGGIHPAWFTIWCAIYLLIVLFSGFFPGSILLATLKVGSIALCLIYVIVYFKKDLPLQIAFIFTLLADIFLAVNNLSAAGIFVFCFAQLTHLYRLSDHIRPILAVIAASAFVAFLALLLPAEQGIIAFGSIYAIALGTNLFLSFDWFKKAQQNKKSEPRALFSASAAFIGFILFACCDVCVLCSFAAAINVIPTVFASIANYLAWIFYYPSQILIAHSSKTVVK